MFECSSIASLHLSATFTSCSDGRHIYSGVIRIETSTFQGRANIIGYLDLSGELTGCNDCDGRKVIRRLSRLPMLAEVRLIILSVPMRPYSRDIIPPYDWS